MTRKDQWIKRPNFECSVCEMAWYCSKECQDQHWKTHKVRCKASSGTKTERTKMKKIARRWENEHKEELEMEREKMATLGKSCTSQRNLQKFCDGDSSSDDDEEGPPDEIT